MACSPPLGCEDRGSQTGGHMNIKQKKTARQMREAGTSYSKIANALGLSENTVKSFCKRNGLTVSGEPAVESNGQVTAFCLNCGRSIIQTPGYRSRKYCSDRCRISWWNKHPASPSRKNTRSFTCLACGRQFDAYGKRDRKYCSRSCYVGSKAVHT